MGLMVVVVMGKMGVRWLEGELILTGIRDHRGSPIVFIAKIIIIII
jgi:hypothetical protein